MPRKATKPHDSSAAADRSSAVQARITADEEAALTRLAARRTLETGKRVTVSDVIREALQAYAPLRRELGA
jgi:hypothetical protein